jgi:signal transduction histidine kinase
MQPGTRRVALDESGPSEVVQAARAFNAMQTRIDAHLSERLHLLAAISHDLQTPITRMRLRVEQVSEPGLRERVEADLDDMQALVEEGLAYAHTTQADREPARPIDLHALLDGLVCDAVDAGHTVTLLGRHEAPVVTRVLALRRLMANLIGNAVKYGGGGPVDVSVCAEGDELKIAVRDRGPGIPADLLQDVLKPFYRVEPSRSRETGGTGLGLAIAHQLSLALGGRLELVNRKGSGLEAALWLPLTPQRCEGNRVASE